MAEGKTVAIVTGASRGAGRGIAIALGAHGCTVYVTGRSQTADDSPLDGTIYETAEAVTKAGGKGIAVRVDHADDEAVKAFFEQVEREQGGVDILVNNAAAVSDEMSLPLRFWEKPLFVGDMIDVGLRSSYVASWYAAPMMVKRGKGLIIFTSASGAVHYVFGPAYGAHKAGMDKFASDMAVDFEGTGVAVLSIWMGALRTQRLIEMMAADPEKLGYLADQIETPEFTGHIIWALWSDPKMTERSGQTVIGAELAIDYGLKDEGGKQPPSYRTTHGVWPTSFFPVVVR